MEKLKVKQAELKGVTDKLQTLNDHLAQKQIEKQVWPGDYYLINWFFLSCENTFSLIL